MSEINSIIDKVVPTYDDSLYFSLDEVYHIFYAVLMQLEIDGIKREFFKDFSEICDAEQTEVEKALIEKAFKKDWVKTYVDIVVEKEEKGMSADDATSKQMRFARNLMETATDRQKELDKLISTLQISIRAINAREATLLNKEAKAISEDPTGDPEGYKTCENCGTVFEYDMHYPQTKYCGVSCRKQAANKRHRGG